ncbi:MAG: DNA recombination protein RmuC [Anaerolineales bacterium]|nr:DNA recombination protein RmuC [Anaerolineales bacterium]
MDVLLLSIILFFVFVLLVAIVALYFQLRKTQTGGSDVSSTLMTLTQSVQQEQAQIAILATKMAHLEPVVQTISNVQVELKGLAERIAHVENGQSAANQGIGTLSNGLVRTESSLNAKVSDARQQSIASIEQVGRGLTGEITRFQKESNVALAELRTLAQTLHETTGAIRNELARAKNDLTELQTNAKSRQELEVQTAESVRRLEAIVAGTQTKGSAGENILDLVFSKLPAEWQVRNFRVGGKLVEFGLRLPNDLILPIDSKWAATNLLEKFIAASDISEQQRLKTEIESAIIKKAKEVKKYIDPSVTVTFGVAVIPDAAYDLCAGAQAEAFQMSVVLISYSMFVPYLLLVFQTMLKTSQSIDLQKLSAHLQTVQNSMIALQSELDGRFSRALTMLNNSRDEMRAHFSKVGSSLTSLQISASNPNTTALPESE